MENVINFYTLKNSLTNDFTDGLIKLKASLFSGLTSSLFNERKNKIGKGISKQLLISFNFERFEYKDKAITFYIQLEREVDRKSVV